MTLLPAFAILIGANRTRSETVVVNQEQEKAFFAELAKMGKERVRASLDHGTISPALVSLAWDWLSLQEAEEKRRQEISNSEQIEIARAASIAAERAATAAERAAAEATRMSAAAERQAAAAERANTRATIALVIAIISIAATAIGIWITHNDTRKIGWAEKQNQSQS